MDDKLTYILRRFAATMVQRFDVNDVLYDLCDNIAALFGATGAGVSVLADDGDLRFVTGTSELVIQIEHVQEEHQAGPCVESFRLGRPVTVSAVSALDRWPAYREEALRVGFNSVAGLPLGAEGARIGSLNVYDVRERDWTPEELDTAGVVADIAAAYVMRSGELAEARQLSAQLREALESRIVIEQAKGMLARDHRIPVDAAFELLRNHSRRNRRPIREVAHAVVELGLQLPHE